MKKYILLLALFMFLFSGCGSISSTPTTDREKAEQTVNDFYKALDKGRFADAYQLFNEEQRNKGTEEEYASKLEGFIKSVKILSIEPYEGAVETERCMRFHVVLDQKFNQKDSLDLPDGEKEEWLVVVKEGEDWKLNPSLFGPNKDVCNELE